MMLSASTWAPVTQMKTDPWAHPVPEAVTSSVQCEKPTLVKVVGSLFCPALTVQPWNRDRARDGWTRREARNKPSVSQHLVYNKNHFDYLVNQSAHKWCAEL